MDQPRGPGGLRGPSDHVPPTLPSSTRAAQLSSPRGGLQPGSAGRPGRTDLPTLQHSRQVPGQGRRAAQLMCAWCLGHVRSDGLLRVGEAIMDARPGAAGKGFNGPPIYIVHPPFLIQNRNGLAKSLRGSAAEIATGPVTAPRTPLRTPYRDSPVTGPVARPVVLLCGYGRTVRRSAHDRNH